MDGTSYSTLPSSSYLGLGSQGDLFHSANYGTYDTGIGSITSHPYQYQTTSFGTHLSDHPQPSSYSNDYLQSTHSNAGYSTQQPQYYPTDRYAQQSTYNQDPLFDDYTQSQAQRHNDTSVAPHKPTTDHQHQTSYSDTTHHHPPASNDNQHHTRSEHDISHHPPPKQQRHPAPEADHTRSEHDLSHHPPPKQQRQPGPDHPRSEHDVPRHPPPKQQRQPGPESNHPRSEHDVPHHPPPKQQRQPGPESNHPRSEHPTSDQAPRQTRHRSPSNGRSGYASETTTKSHNRPPKQPPPPPPVARHHSPSNAGNGYTSETGTKPGNAAPGTKTTKSTQMRAAAIKQKEETSEQKRQSGNFPALKKKPTPPKPTKSQPKPGQHPATDAEQSDAGNAKRNKKQANSVPQQRKSRRDDHRNEDNDSSVDGENDSRHHTRSKSQKRTAHSDPHSRKHPPLLPPVRRGRGPAYYDPYYDYQFPGGHPPRGRYPNYDDYPYYGPHPYGDPYDYRHRHLYEDAYDVPPYLAAYHDPYDGFFDYEKRKTKSKLKKHHDKKEYTTDHEDRGGITGNETERDDANKSQLSKKSKTPKHSPKDDENGNDEYKRQHRPAGGYYNAPYYDEGHMLELWRQERNDYLKKKFKPTIHDVLYSQQWMKSDSYLENQRRRALRDTQGYYFPYKKYTLKDYKDLQKVESQQNPYASVNETTLDRKERAKKRHDYGSLVERHAADVSGGQQKTPRDAPPKKPWHINNGEPQDSEKMSKRDRALEYAKVQVVKHRPHKSSTYRAGASDPTEQYVNSLFPQENDDGEGSVNERNNQSDDDDDQ